MTGELLPPTAQSHITESLVEAQAVEPLQDSAGVSALHEQEVLVTHGSRRHYGDDECPGQRGESWGLCDVHRQICHLTLLKPARPTSQVRGR